MNSINVIQRIKFKAEFNELSVRAQRVFKETGADNLDTFYEEFLENKTSEFDRLYHSGISVDSFEEYKKGVSAFRKATKRQLEVNRRYNLKNVTKDLTQETYDFKQHNFVGIKTEWQIEKFKVRVKEILKQFDKQPKSGIFYEVDLFIQQNKKYSRLEKAVVKSYSGGIGRHHNLGLTTALAKKFNRTKERVRQIYVKVPSEIKSLAKILTEEYHSKTDKYFKIDCFLVNDSAAVKINNTENTAFSPAFIAIMLRYCMLDNYEFYEVHGNKRKYYVACFIKKRNFDIASCLNYLASFLTSKRSEDVVIDTDDLMQKFYNSAEDKSGLKIPYPKMKGYLQKIIQHYVNAILKTSVEDYIKNSTFYLTRNYLVLNKNCPQFLYNQVNTIREILLSNKRPLHYKEIFKRFKPLYTGKVTVASIHPLLIKRKDIFILKGPGTYGLKEWGGYSGTLGNVAEQYLTEQNRPVLFEDIKEFLLSQLVISGNSISGMLFYYDHKKRFVKTKDGYVHLRKWLVK